MTEAARAKTRILLVEDEVAVLLYTEMILADHGYEVVMAGDGARGLELARERAPDLIVTDFMMPRMDGVEMLRRIRSEGIDAPAIIVSAIPRAQLPIAADETRLFDEVLAKPIVERNLVERLKRVL